MTPKLSILICTLPNRSHFYQRLITSLYEQRQAVGVDLIEILADTHPTDTIGQKRNRLLQNASGEYIVFVDDDDRASDVYIKVILEGIEQNVDAIELRGIITVDGKDPKLFIHSNKYDHWFEKDNVYYRNNNHLSPVRASIAKQMVFPETNMGEDHDYSKQLQRSGLIKTEWPVNEPYYFYDYRSNK